MRVAGDAASKLVPRSEKGIFVGYDTKREFCYRVKVEHREITVVSRDVRFSEDQFTMAAEEQQTNKGAEEAPSRSANGAQKIASANDALISRSAEDALSSAKEALSRSAKGALKSRSANWCT